MVGSVCLDGDFGLLLVRLAILHVRLCACRPKASVVENGWGPTVTIGRIFALFVLVSSVSNERQLLVSRTPFCSSILPYRAYSYPSGIPYYCHGTECSFSAVGELECTCPSFCLFFSQPTFLEPHRRELCRHPMAILDKAGSLQNIVQQCVIKQPFSTEKLEPFVFGP